MLKNMGVGAKRIIAIMLIIALSNVNFVIIGSYLQKGLISYATEEKDINELVVVSQELITNKVYEIEGSKKRIIQIAIETGINEKEYPIKTTAIELNTNLFNETLETVDVNYNNKVSFTEGTWILNKENNKLNITLNNSNEEQTEKLEGLDKLVITYVYEYNEETAAEEITSVINNVTLKLFSEEVKIENKENTFEIKEEVGEALILNKEIQDIHKTKMLDKTEYTETIKLNLNYKNFTNKIEIEDKLNEFYNNEGEVEDIPLTYKNTKINKENLLSIIGEEGTITIKDIETGCILMELNKEKINKAKLDEEEIIKIKENEEKIEVAKIIISENEVEIDYLGNTNKLKITIENISKSERVIQNAILEIVNTKDIGKIENLETLNYLLENTTVVSGVIENELENKINFKDTITKASVSLDNTTLYTNQENEVIFTITLNTAEEKTELYKSPVVLVELPSYITNAKAGHIKLLNNNDDTFTIKQAYIGNILGKKIALVALEGEQLEKTTEETNLKIELKMGLTMQSEIPEEITPIKIHLKNNTVTAYEGTTADMATMLQEVTVENKVLSNSMVLLQSDVQSSNIEELNVGMYITTTNMENIIKPGENLEYNIYLNNYEETEIENIQLTDILPEGMILQKVVELTKNEETLTYKNEKEIAYNYNEQTREVTVNLDKLAAATREEIQVEENSATETIVMGSNRVIKITVKADNLGKDVYSKEIINMANIKKENKVLAEAEVKNTVSDAILVVTAKSLPKEINEKQDIVFEIKIENKGLIDAQNVKDQISVPEEIILRMGETYILSQTGEQENKTEFTINTNTYEINNIEIPAGKTYYIELTGTAKDIEATKEITATGDVNGEEILWTTEIVNIPGEEDAPDEPNAPDTTDEPNNPSEPETPNNPDEPDNPDNPNNPNDPTNSNNPTVEEKEFDLSLKQTVNKITVTNPQGTTVYEYTNTNFAKVELKAKEIEGTVVTLEYNIVVKNEGNVPGYARKIVDYLDKGLTFNSEINADWYVGDDGNLYSVTLHNTLLNPGESKEIKLILTKTMTKENTGLVNNIAEIYEATNEEEIEDINSIPGDKLENQNDISKIEVLFAIKTGKVFIYITLALTVIAIITFGIYKINKKVVTKRGGC